MNDLHFDESELGIPKEINHNVWNMSEAKSLDDDAPPSHAEGQESRTMIRSHSRSHSRSRMGTLILYVDSYYQILPAPMEAIDTTNPTLNPICAGCDNDISYEAPNGNNVKRMRFISFRDRIPHCYTRGEKSEDDRNEKKEEGRRSKKTEEGTIEQTLFASLFLFYPFILILPSYPSFLILPF